MVDTPTPSRYQLPVNPPSYRDGFSVEDPVARNDINRQIAATALLSAKLETGLDRLDQKLDRVQRETDIKIEKVGDDCQKRMDRIDGRLSWLIGIAFTILVTLLTGIVVGIIMKAVALHP